MLWFMISLEMKLKNNKTMKNKIKFKHLAPYLPYSIEYATRRFCPVALKIKIEKQGVIDRKGSSNNFNKLLDFDDYFIILKPLSDLENLVREAHDATSPTNEQQLLVGLFWGGFQYSFRLNKCVNFMFKNHYDFFGLIDKGVAISIHDVK